MPRSTLLLLLLPILLLGYWLARGALNRWRDQRSAVTYEITADLRPAMLRAGGAVLCGMCATALAVAAVLGSRGVLGGAGAAGAGGAQSLQDGTAQRPEAPPTPAAGAANAVAAVASGSAKPSARPSASASGSAAAVPVRFETVSHPAEGELLQAAVPTSGGKSRNVRVWLPAHYGDDPSVRFPVIVLQAGTPGRTADSEIPDVFDGIASAIKLGKARPFVVVAPEGPKGTGRPCDLVAAAPQALADDAALRTAVAAAFRTLPPGPQGWAALGVDGGAPCAAAAGLTRGDLYGAAAAVSGRYDAGALAQAGADAPAGAAPQLLLAAAKGDADGLGSARQVKNALHAGKGQAARALVSTSDIVEDYAADRERLRLVRIAAQYLAETLAHPGD
ncbi:hypothetical protein P3T37_006471 [Kitasatospora sp. MAA4]|uniref:hypothetical protein n=1 Tax=Kitasatospora sp. MAA4 TaxID=3035093 RepID=UPI002474D256|nr:hypothetical protein [Kitasatospora sp. MAA4]MDH6137040.1 hypothetical protein [Kitasatospora sp. MAA4]